MKKKQPVLVVLFMAALFTLLVLFRTLDFTGHTLQSIATVARSALQYMEKRLVLLLVGGCLLCEALLDETHIRKAQITLLILVLFLYCIVLLISRTYNPFTYFRF